MPAKSLIVYHHRVDKHCRVFTTAEFRNIFLQLVIFCFHSTSDIQTHETGYNTFVNSKTSYMKLLLQTNADGKTIFGILCRTHTTSPHRYVS